jgi:Bax protein
MSNTDNVIDPFRRLTRLLGSRKVALILFMGALLAGLFAATVILRQERLTQPRVEVEPISVFPDFASIADVEIKKQMFFDFLELYIAEQNILVRETRDRINELSDVVADGVPLSEEERAELLDIAQGYFLDHEKMRDSQVLFELLKRVDTIPTPLALAQAANESAWGTSRFALEANNIFGQWCYDEGCGVVPSRRRADASHEVRAFDTIDEAVQAYFLNLNTHERYQNFRNMRFQMRNQRGELDPLVLAYGLEGYSERGDRYVDEIQTIIQQNDLVDKYSG